MNKKERLERGCALLDFKVFVVAVFPFSSDVCVPVFETQNTLVVSFWEGSLVIRKDCYFRGSTTAGEGKKRRGKCTLLTLYHSSSSSS